MARTRWEVGALSDDHDASSASTASTAPGGSTRGTPAAVSSGPRPVTPMDRLAAIDAELDSLDDVDLADQVGAFDRMHTTLTAALAVTVDQSGRDPGGGGQPSLPYEDR